MEKQQQRVGKIEKGKRGARDRAAWESDNKAVEEGETVEKNSLNEIQWPQNLLTLWAETKKGMER